MYEMNKELLTYHDIDKNIANNYFGIHKTGHNITGQLTV
jgi:hypothetical protein